MVGMQAGEDRPDGFRRNPGPQHASHRADAAVNEVSTAVHDEQRGWLRSVRSHRRTSGGAKKEQLCPSVPLLSHRCGARDGSDRDDGDANDGEYARNFTQTSVAGTYTFTLRATGYTRDAEPVNREVVRSKYVEGTVRQPPNGSDGLGGGACCKRLAALLERLVAETRKKWVDGSADDGAAVAVRRAIPSARSSHSVGVPSVSLCPLAV